MAEEELGEFLRILSHNACSTKRAIKILDLICQDAVKERDYQFGRDAIVQSIVRNMRFNGQELEKLEKVQARLLKVLNYHLETIPGISNVTACALVGNIGDIQRFSSADKLANFAGVAPICHSSAGKGKNVQNKTQGNRELYNVLYFLAIQQIYVSSKREARNPVLRAYFEYKVSQGKTKIQALICIMRRLIRVIYSMMKYKTEYKMPEIKEQMIS